MIQQQQTPAATCYSIYYSSPATSYSYMTAQAALGFSSLKAAVYLTSVEEALASGAAAGSATTLRTYPGGAFLS